jgi:hypothetical protein
VAVGALWLFLKQPGAESEMHGDALTKMITENGACLLAVTVSQKKGGIWDFRLFAMPRWPALIPSAQEDGAGHAAKVAVMRESPHPDRCGS